MSSRLALLTVALILLIPAAARASTAGGQRQGQILVAQLRAHTTTCGAISAGGLDHIGEYVMSRALGSTALRQAMSQRMLAMIGGQDEARMYRTLGAGYVGCSGQDVRIAEGASMMGDSGMMGGYAANGGINAMMNSGEWNWVMGGTWRHMNRQDWQRREQQLFSLGSTTQHSLSVVAIIAGVFGVGIVVVSAAVAILRKPFRRPPAAPAGT